MQAKPYTTSRRYRVAVLIGRFQPFHLGHLRTLLLALSVADYVVVLTGSAWHARTLRNPFLTREVENMIRGCLGDEDNARVGIDGIADAYNDAAWIESVHAAVASVSKSAGIAVEAESDICLVGHRKDATSAYLDLFPRWGYEAAPAYGILDATTVRNAWMEDKEVALEQWLPQGSMDVVRNVGTSPAYDWLLGEKAAMLSRPVDSRGRPQLVYTCDGVVTQSGYVMLVSRDKPPGKGLLSLPGGFLKEQETSRKTLVWNLVADHGLMTSPRRSREEAAALVDGCVTASELFDHPLRSDRGRAVSSTFLVELPPAGEGGLAPLRKGPLGAADWYPLAQLDALRERMFDDHGHIGRRMVSRSRWA